MSVADWNSDPDRDAVERALKIHSINPTEGQIELERLAGRGSLLSMYFLGINYWRGDGVDRDLAEAERWLRKATDGDLVVASYYLGVLYKNQKKYDEAHVLFSRGASAGYTPAMNSLALLHFNGQGLPRNILAARDLWEEGAKRGHLRSRRNLGAKMAMGFYGLPSIPKGFSLFISAYTAVPTVILSEGLSERLR